MSSISWIKNLWRQAGLAIFGLIVWTGTSQSTPIQNDVFWKDSSGNLIYSQGGGMLKVKDTCYWYGVNYAGAATYAASPAGGKKGASFKSVVCYSSTDFVHWKFEGDALAQDQTGGGWFGRIGVVYNAETQKYVLIGQGRSPEQKGGVNKGGVYFATSSNPVGPFKFANVQTDISFITNGGTGDQTTFQDDDGCAYVICCSKKGRSHLYVAPLRSSDFLAIDSAKQIYSGDGREGNCMFKYQGHYYFCSSNLHGWNASPTYVISATKILGPYSKEFIMPGTEADFSHVTQTGFYFNVNGTSQTTVVFAGDRWCDFGGNGIGYNQWCPLSFNGTTPVFNSLSQWDLDAKTGVWTVGVGNNYVLNPSFEADREPEHALAGWANTTNISGGDPNGNSRKGESHTGNFCMQQRYATNYTASMAQKISLPNGTYTLSAWVKSSGGQNSANLVAKNFGGTDLSYSLAKEIRDWALVSIPGIVVTNGTCQVAINSNAKADNWVEVDDISLVNSSATKMLKPITTNASSLER